MTVGAAILGLSAGLALMTTLPAFAAAPARQDMPPDGMAAAAGVTILEPSKPTPAMAKARPKGNPLWAIPLSPLTATRARPIFLPTRRPPAPVIANTPIVAPKPVAAPPPEQSPRLALVGAVSGENESIAVFVDQVTNGVIRLWIGQNHDGWVLSSVKGRQATLQKDQKIVVLNLPAPGSPPPVTGIAGIPLGSMPSRAPETGIVVPYPSRGAPYVPRHTPKNGESDGL